MSDWDQLKMTLKNMNEEEELDKLVHQVLWAKGSSRMRHRFLIWKNWLDDIKTRKEAAEEHKAALSDRRNALEYRGEGTRGFWVYD